DRRPQTLTARLRRSLPPFRLISNTCFTNATEMPYYAPETMIDLTHNCAGMPRRDFLQLGVGAVLGLGFSDILRLRAHAAASQVASKSAGKQVNCIMIWLDGGPSHYETFDPKPDAPSEIRGEVK